MAKGLMKELDNKSREFYEFVMPAIDMYEDGSDLVVMIDLPGFSKKDISLRITGNILAISARRDPQEILGAVYCRHRPATIDKKVMLPISVKEEEGSKAVMAGKATYADGVVTIKIPIPKSANIPIT